jgi:hypothetical protein
MCRYERFNVECHMDHRAKNHYQHHVVVIDSLEVQSEIRAYMTSDRQTLFVTVYASAKRNMSLVGGCNGHTILSEGHGCGCQEEYLVSDG